MKLIKILSILLIMIISCSAVISANSLWKSDKSVFSDRKALKEGDLITILIQETSFASTDNSNKRQKDIEIGGQTGADAEKDKTFLNSLAKMIPLFGATATGGSKYESQGKIGKRGTIKAQITVRVKDIDDNNNLELEGKRTIFINNEKQNITIKGFCRADDVMPNNTIYSTYIADAEIVYDGKNVIGNKKRKGAIGRFFESVFNFLF